jgi:hypothetical protein
MRAYAAMQATFRTRGGRYRRDGRPRLPGQSAHLWPFSRAFVATLDVAGMERGAALGFDAGTEIADRLRGLERYWAPARGALAYSSDVVGTRVGGDRYYDDNAWVGLGLMQLERMRPGSGHLERARQLFEFAVHGWDATAGGVYWVEQGVGTGKRNHDRNTVSTAPNAELGLHLAELGAAPVSAPGGVGPLEMYEWVVENLDAGGDGEASGVGLFFDKIRGDGSLDRTIWSYNQGSMVGAGVLLARAGGVAGVRYLHQAQAIATKALAHFSGERLHRQPPAFNAIFFRNLLLLHAATEDAALQGEILGAMREYAEWAWTTRRDRRNRFDFPNGGVTLLNQSAIVQILALLAWDPATYGRLA